MTVSLFRYPVSRFCSYMLLYFLAMRFLDTPRLEHLSLADNQLQSFKIISMSDSVKVKIDVDTVLTNYDLSVRNILYNFLYNFSAVRDMTLSQYTLELIDRLSHMSPLPKFRDLTRLHATMRLDRCLELLPFVFERCQNLKHLTLKLVEYLDEATSLSNMLSFRLVSSSLEYVEIESPITEKAAHLVRYFLGNVTSLKKLVLRLNVFREEKHDPVLLKQLVDSPRRSNLCQFELLLLYKPPTFGSCLESISRWFKLNQEYVHEKKGMFIFQLPIKAKALQCKSQNSIKHHFPLFEIYYFKIPDY